jgi:hypothetical protein
VPITADILPDGVDALKAALVAERSARQQAEARAWVPRPWSRI